MLTIAFAKMRAWDLRKFLVLAKLWVTGYIAQFSYPQCYIGLLTFLNRVAPIPQLIVLGEGMSERFGRPIIFEINDYSLYL